MMGVAEDKRCLDPKSASSFPLLLCPPPPLAFCGGTLVINEAVSLPRYLTVYKVIHVTSTLGHSQQPG